MDKSDNKYLKKIIGEEGALIEINEMTAFALNKSNDFSIGSFINIYNEASAAYFDEKSPIKISLPVEIGLSQIKEISKNIKSPLEVIVFGKLPLSLSARCYMAKHYKKNKQNCMMVCKDHKEGIGLKTLDNKNILCVNGTMVMSGKTYFLKEEEIKKLQENNVSSFKIFPTQDLTFKAIEYYSDILDRKDNNDFMNLDSFNDYFYS
jgi:collagenase-like PrtC family protease